VAFTKVGAGGDITVDIRTVQNIDAGVVYLDRRDVPQRPVRLAPRSVNFVGREELLSRIHERLTGPGPMPRLLALHGLGGVGKTSLAVEYAHVHGGAYNLLWQLPAADPMVLSNAWAELAGILGVRDLGDSADPVAQVHAALAARADRWLLLLDNVKDSGTVADMLPPVGPGYVIVTTRSAYWPDEVGLGVPVLEQSAAATFLLASAVPDPADPDQSGTAAALAAELGALPLAIEQARAYMQEAGRTLREYRVLLDRRRAELLSRGQPWGYESRVASTWDLSFEALGSSAPDAVTLLRLASWWAPEAIPLDLLLGTPQSAVAAFRDPDVAARVASLTRDTFAVDDARRALGSYSLLRTGRGSMVTVHRLVQAVTLDRLDDSARAGWRDAAAALVEAALPPDPDDPATWSSFALLLPHAMATLGPGQPALSVLLGYLDASGDYTTARGLQEQVVKDLVARLGEDAAEALDARARLAIWIGREGDPRAARDRFARLRGTAERLWGPEHLRTLSFTFRLADWTGQAGDWAGARDVSAQALPVLRRIAGDDHPETIELWNNLGFYTGQAGDPVAACAIYEQFMPLQERVLGTLHRDTLAVRDQYARFVGNAGDPSRALALVAGVLRDHERAMGAEHMGTLWIRSNLAWWTGEAGDPARAVELYRELMPVRERVSGPRHPATQVAVANLAYWTGIAGDAATARDLFLDILPRRREVLGPEHPETLLIEENVAEWTGEAGDPCHARHLWEAVLTVYERIHGPDHVRTHKAESKVVDWAARCDATPVTDVVAQHS
jgi:hypothetical protein